MHHDHDHDHGEPELPVTEHFHYRPALPAIARCRNMRMSAAMPTHTNDHIAVEFMPFAGLLVGVKTDDAPTTPAFVIRPLFRYAR